MLRRVLAAVALAAVVPAAARADEKGQAILEAAYKKLHAARSLSADVKTTIAMSGVPGAPPPSTTKGTVKALKPNYFKWVMTGPGAESFYADGKHYYRVMAGQPRYFKQDLDPDPRVMYGNWEGEIDGFFGGAQNAKDVDATLAGSDMVNGKEVHLVRTKLTMPDRTVVYAIGKNDGLIHRSELTMSLQGGLRRRQVNELTNLKLNPPLTPAEFKFTPPPGAEEFTPPDFAGRLIPVGREAPAFTLPAPEGGKVSLTGLLKGRKALLVNFWFYG